MDQLNMQQTWAPVPGMKKTYSDQKKGFIFHKDKPKYRREEYVRAVCDIRPKKKDTHRTRLTAGEKFIDYPGEVIMSTTVLTTA